MYKINEQGILSPIMNALKTFFLYKEILLSWVTLISIAII